MPPFKDRVLVTRTSLPRSPPVRRRPSRRDPHAPRRGQRAGDEPARRPRRDPLEGPGPCSSKATVLGFVERRVDGRNVSTGEPKDYSCDVEIDFAPTLEVPRPFAYLIPPGYFKAIDILRAHGIQAETLDAGERNAGRGGTRSVDAARSRRRFEGPETIDVTETRIRIRAADHPRRDARRPDRAAAGSASLAVYLLEPRSDDGLATWKCLRRQPSRRERISPS